MTCLSATGQVFSFGKGPWDPTHRFETSWLLPPFILFAVRLLISLYTLVARLYIIGYTCTHDSDGCQDIRDEFSYFTILTNWGLLSYFLFAAIHTGTYALTGTPLLDRLPRPFKALHSLLYSTIVTFPFLVTIVYWVILYDGPWFPIRFVAWKNVSQHGLNSLFALFELVFPRTDPLPWIHVLWLVVILALYVSLAYLTKATKGWLPYDFLDPGPEGLGGPRMVVAYVFGILAAILVIFFVIVGLMYLRRWIVEAKLHMGGKFKKDTVKKSRDVEMAPARAE